MPHGRGTMHFAFTFGGAPQLEFCVVRGEMRGKFFAMENDVVTTATALKARLCSNKLRRRIHELLVERQYGDLPHGSSVCGSGPGVPKAVAGLLTANGPARFP